MIQDLIVKDNFFTDTSKIVSLAKTQEYYHPRKEDYWAGMRSSELRNVLNKDDLNYIYDAISNNLFHSALNGGIRYSFEYKCDMYFHYLDENIQHKETFIHQDDCLMAGVVYLTENPKDNSGTFVIQNDVKSEISNVFNRCVIYNANVFHAPANGFGNTKDDARLTLNIFFTEINIVKPEKII